MTGLAGWISAVQQKLFGGYLVEASVVLTFAMVTIGLSIVTDWIVRRRTDARSARPGASAVPQPRREPSQGRTWFGIWAALMLVTWGVGMGAWYAQAHEERADANARYVPVVLDALPVPKPLDYVALTGRPRYERSLEHRVGSAGAPKQVKDVLVPVTAPDAPAAAAVPFVARFAVLPRAPDGGTTTLLGHVEGPVPLPAVQAFTRAGVPVDESTRLVRVVPSKNGQPDVRLRAAREFTTVLQVCGGASGMFTLAVLVLAALQRRRGVPR